MVVDDEASIRDISKQNLEAFGYTVMVAAEGPQAVDLYAPRRHEGSLVLIDMMMPIRDGATLSSASRKINPDVRIIVVSGEAKTNDKGINHFLTKPFSARQMLMLVVTVPSS